MEEKRENRKVKYTKMVLRESLLELMQTRPINKISVKDICEGADINRGTFYSHYNDAYDLLSQIQKELFTEIQIGLDRIIVDTSSTTDIVSEIFEKILEQSDLCRIIFSEYGDADFLKQIFLLAKEHCLKEWTQYKPKIDDLPFESMYSFTANGIVGLIQEWIKTGMKEKPRDFAETVMLMAKRGLSAFLEID